MRGLYLVVFALFAVLAVSVVALPLSMVRLGSINFYLVTSPSEFEQALASFNGHYLYILYADSQCIACNILKAYVFTNETLAEYLSSHFIPIYVDLDYASAQPLMNIMVYLNGSAYVVEAVGNRVAVYETGNATGPAPLTVEATPTAVIALDKDGSLIIKEVIIGTYPTPIYLYALSLVNAPEITKLASSSAQSSAQAYASQPLGVSLSTLALSYVAGLGSAIMPCALPALASIVLLSINRKIRPWALFGGFLIFYVVIGYVLGLVGTGGIVKSILYLASSAVLMFMGLVFLIPQLYSAFIRLTSMVQGASGRFKGGGALGDFALGMVLTGLWLPCVGPIFAGVVIGSLIASQISHNVAVGLSVTTLFALGFITVAAIIFKLSSMGRGIAEIAKWGKYVEKASGVAMIALGAYLLALTLW